MTSYMAVQHGLIILAALTYAAIFRTIAAEVRSM
jgi:hypothetical protein